MLAPLSTFSQSLVSIERYAILAPYTAGIALGAFFTALDALGFGSGELPAGFLLYFLALLLPMSCLWVMAREFAHGGRVALSRLPRYILGGAGLILMPFLWQLYDWVDRIRDLPDFTGPLGPPSFLVTVIAGGWPVLLVAVHLFYERSQQEGL